MIVEDKSLELVPLQESLQDVLDHMAKVLNMHIVRSAHHLLNKERLHRTKSSLNSRAALTIRLMDCVEHGRLLVSIPKLVYTVIFYEHIHLIQHCLVSILADSSNILNQFFPHPIQVSQSKF